MTVEDLIEKLKKEDPKAVVLLASSNFELNNSDVELTHVWHSKTGKEETKTFRDAFDGDTYNTKVWSTIGGDKSIVHLSA